MKKRIFLTLMILVLITALLPACGREVPPEDIEIVENSLLIDEETGNYTAVVVIKNNGDVAVQTPMLEGTALDKDGNAVTQLNDAEGFLSIIPSFGTVQPGEQDVWYESSYTLNSGVTIYNIYADAPDRIEWEVAEAPASKVKESAGLEITGFEAGDPYTDEDGATTVNYSLTLQNNGNIEYAFDPERILAPETKYGNAMVRIICLYRDADGKIAGASELVSQDPKSICLAPGESSTSTWINIGQYYPDLEPEMHVSVTFIEGE